LGKPIVGTSANLSGHPSALTAAEVQDQIGDKIDMVIDGGRCPGGIESTVIDLSGEKTPDTAAGRHFNRKTKKNIARYRDGLGVYI